MEEADIQRYGRQILLRELGGRGQRALLTARVEVLAEGPGADAAVTYLRAGGTPVERSSQVASGPSLLRVWSAAGEAGVVAVAGGVAWRTPGGCEACWTQTMSELPPAAGAEVLLGALAALTTQRLVLGWAAPAGLVCWREGRLHSAEPLRCDAHRAV